MGHKLVRSLNCILIEFHQKPTMFVDDIYLKNPFKLTIMIGLLQVPIVHLYLNSLLQTGKDMLACFRER